MKKNGIDLTKRVRIDPGLAKTMGLRMKEIGFHPEQYLHMGELTWLFTHREWVMITKKGNTGVSIYPPDKTMGDVNTELGDW